MKDLYWAQQEAEMRKSSVLDFGDLQKGKRAYPSHKYLRREPKPGGGWNYFYDIPKGHAHLPYHGTVVPEKGAAGGREDVSDLPETHSDDYEEWDERVGELHSMRPGAKASAEEVADYIKHFSEEINYELDMEPPGPDDELQLGGGLELFYVDADTAYEWWSQEQDAPDDADDFDDADDDYYNETVGWYFRVPPRFLRNKKKPGSAKLGGGLLSTMKYEYRLKDARSTYQVVQQVQAIVDNLASGKKLTDKASVRHKRVQAWGERQQAKAKRKK